MKFTFEPIAFVQSPFKDRFAVPRQPGLAESANGSLHFQKSENLKLALKDLDGFSHLWIIFVFHEHGSESWKPTVRPPRLGGNKKIGVLSTRSPHRPNPIGISCVEIAKIDLNAPSGPRIDVKGLDLIDGTPVLDIKPYLPYADSFPSASSGWASEEIKKYEVLWEKKADESLKNLAPLKFESMKSMIEDVLCLDPRPAFQKRKHPVEAKESAGLCYGFDLDGLDIKYKINQTGFLVTEILLYSSEKQKK